MTPLLNLSPLASFFARLDPVGWSVLLLLAALFAGMLAVVGARMWLALRQRPLIRAFRAAFAEVTDGAELAPLARTPEAQRHPFGRLAACAVASLARPGAGDPAHRAERLYRALQTQLEREVAEREWGLTMLATAANTAPYIGLFGTVWSIYHALAAIAQSGEATLAAVAGPVGEALIMTAIGLGVAIPAAIAHNLFARSNRLVVPEYEAFAHECYLLLTLDAPSADPQTTNER